jgi:hypothetical protein
MKDTRFVGTDIHKERISIAVAESGRSGAVNYLGEIANDPGAISKLCDRLRRPGKPRSNQRQNRCERNLSGLKFAALSAQPRPSIDLANYQGASPRY